MGLRVIPQVSVSLAAANQPRRRTTVFESSRLLGTQIQFLRNYVHQLFQEIGGSSVVSLFTGVFHACVSIFHYWHRLVWTRARSLRMFDLSLSCCMKLPGEEGEGGGVTPSTPRLKRNNYANDLAVCRGTLLAHKSPSAAVGHLPRQRVHHCPKGFQTCWKPRVGRTQCVAQINRKVTDSLSNPKESAPKIK